MRYFRLRVHLDDDYSLSTHADALKYSLFVDSESPDMELIFDSDSFKVVNKNRVRFPPAEFRWGQIDTISLVDGNGEFLMLVPLEESVFVNRGDILEFSPGRFGIFVLKDQDLRVH